MWSGVWPPRLAAALHPPDTMGPPQRRASPAIRTTPQTACNSPVVPLSRFRPQGTADSHSVPGCPATLCRGCIQGAWHHPLSTRRPMAPASRRPSLPADGTRKQGANAAQLHFASRLRPPEQARAKYPRAEGLAFMPFAAAPTRVSGEPVMTPLPPSPHVPAWASPQKLISRTPPLSSIYHQVRTRHVSTWSLVRPLSTRWNSYHGPQSTCLVPSPTSLSP